MSKCNKCNEPAIIHYIQIKRRKSSVRHLCEQCAIAEGIAVKKEVALNELLNRFVMEHFARREPEGGSQASAERDD
jgi:protein-arginine kinase activator protein McsA